MPTPTKNNNEIKRYLLGVLSQEARQQVEERLLTEEDFFDELLLNEDELIDQYINDALPVEDRDRFESHFLSTPERLQKYRFGLALNRYVSEKSAGDSDEVVETPRVADAAVEQPTKLSFAERWRGFWGKRTWALSAATALALVVVVAGALWLARPRTSPPQSFTTITLNISPNNRAEGTQAVKVKLPLERDALRISLVLPERPNPATRYRAELMNDNGETKTLEIDGRDAQSVSIVIPSAQLARGQYALRLFKSTDDGTEQRIPGSYLFNVE